MSIPEIASQPPEISPLRRPVASRPFIGWVGFGLSIVGLGCAVIPALSLVAGGVILAAFVLSVVTFAATPRRPIAAIALALSLIAGFTAIIISFVTVFSLATGFTNS